ncbi:MAG: hypothetical protein M0006_15635 [Magnetospirillum sp.]|nr:hypothetical protein [Magnetospirillum sp.]
MTNHPNRSTISFRFIAFSTVSGNSLFRAATAVEARDMAIKEHHLDDDAYVEVLDCGENGRKVWDRGLPLHQAREGHEVVFRGAGYPHLPAIAL